MYEIGSNVINKLVLPCIIYDEPHGEIT